MLREESDAELTLFAIKQAEKLGAEYAEARLQSTTDTVCRLRNGTPEPPAMDDSRGIGVRVLVGGGLAFAASNNLNRDNVKEIVGEAVKRARASSILLPQKIVFSETKPASANWKAEEKRRLEDVSVEEIYQLLGEIDSKIANGFDGVSFPVRYNVLDKAVEEKVFETSEGTHLSSRVPRLAGFFVLTALSEGRTVQRIYQVGETGGWEAKDRMELEESVAEEAEIMAKVLKTSTKPPTDTVDVVLSPELSGIAAHESTGHPYEADRILGREAAQAGESYLKAKDVGKRIGSAEAYVSDDPTLPHSLGFYLYDEEGVKAVKRQLLKAGLVNELLQNRATGTVFKVNSNASARAVQYNVEPIIRMANTFVEPGDYSFEELLDGVKEGVYIKSFTEWNIDDKRMNARYVGLEAYHIQNGELKEMVRSPVLEISTPKFWGSVASRAKDLDFKAATCGKGEPSQGAPVWTGGPHMKLTGIRLGAR